MYIIYKTAKLKMILALVAIFTRVKPVNVLYIMKKNVIQDILIQT